MPLVAGSVIVDETGEATIDPSPCLAGEIYLAKLKASDEYTVLNGGTVAPDDQRVKLLQWYAKRSTKIAVQLATYINANV